MRSQWNVGRRVAKCPFQCLDAAVDNCSASFQNGRNGLYGHDAFPSLLFWLVCVAPRDRIRNCPCNNSVTRMGVNSVTVTRRVPLCLFLASYVNLATAFVHENQSLPLRAGRMYRIRRPWLMTRKGTSLPTGLSAFFFFNWLCVMYGECTAK